MKKLLPLSLVCAALSTAHAAELQVTVNGIQQKGDLYLALFDQEGFPQKPIAREKIASGQSTTAFRNLAPGKYALSTFQDLNGNGALDRNLIGAPTEPYGFSNDAKGTMGPPGFDAAAVDIGTGNRAIAITLR